MPFKLVVVKAPSGSSAAHEAIVFNQDRVVIGRDAACDLHLSDPKRVVSKQHAEIAQTGSGFQLTDLGSKNFTYLNGDRLQADSPYPVRPGDAVQIGEYEIRLEVVEAAPEPAAPGLPDFDVTVFEPSFVNPFEEGAALLAAALRDLGKNYEQVAPQRRGDALREAMEGLLDERGEKALEAIAHVVAGDDADTATPVPQRTPPPPAFDEPEWPPVSRPEPPPAWMAEPDAAPMGAAPAGRVDEALDVLLRIVTRLLGAPWQFRHEFIGQTVMQTEEAAFLQDAGPDELKQYLLDPGMPDEQARQRLHRLEEEGEDVALHLLALLDGYKAGVREGAKRLIDQFHPEALVEQVTAEGGALYRLLPPLAKAAALDRMEEQLRELRQEDWSTAEPRAYRPAFIRAYLARMTAPRPRSEE